MLFLVKWPFQIVFTSNNILEFFVQNICTLQVISTRNLPSNLKIIIHPTHHSLPILRPPEGSSPHFLPSSKVDVEHISVYSSPTTFHSPSSHSDYQTYKNSFSISFLLNFYQSNLVIKTKNKIKTNKICLKPILGSPRLKYPV